MKRKIEVANNVPVEVNELLTKEQRVNSFILVIPVRSQKKNSCFLFKIATRKKLVNNKMLYVLEECSGVQIPLEKTFKLFLETPGIFRTIMDYVHSLSIEKHVITNIMQCDVWLDKFSQKSADFILLPFYIFVDEFESGNPLSGKAGKNKFAAVYAALACLPEKIASKLDSILFSTLIPVPEKKKLDEDDGSNEKIFKVLINEINELRRKGIFINDSVKKINVKFQLILILGDNLGLNGILGFVESFHTAYCCRICKPTLQNTLENNKILRTKENYKLDIVRPNIAQSGIKQECVFHKVDDFHVLDNISVDFLHDFIEGIVAYVMFVLVKYFILEAKYFNLEYLNAKIKELHFGAEEDYNKPSPISSNRLKENVTLKMSAAETLTFTYFFGILIGDCIPKENEHWKLFKKTRKISYYHLDLSNQKLII